MMPFVGVWFWWIMAGILLLAELMLPGVFFIWLAAAAALVGVADLVWDMSWQFEVLLFAGLSLVLVLTGWPWLQRMRNPKSDQPHLNRRMDGLVGRVFALDKAIENGRGKISINDTLWDVEGPDMAAGARVRVTAVSGLRLVVEPA